MRYRETRIFRSTCPYCLKKLDGAASLIGAVPNPGDISICLYCKYTLVFGEDMQFRKPKVDELSWEDIEQVQAAREMLERSEKK